MTTSVRIYVAFILVRLGMRFVKAGMLCLTAKERESMPNYRAWKEQSE